MIMTTLYRQISTVYRIAISRPTCLFIFHNCLLAGKEFVEYLRRSRISTPLSMSLKKYLHLVTQ